ncbi:MAG: hypothetical protein ACR2IE_00885 [Candidatus Sumerlaeaceae bacterium]
MSTSANQATGKLDDNSINFLNYFHYYPHSVVVRPDAAAYRVRPRAGRYGEWQTTATVLRVLKGELTTGSQLAYYCLVEADNTTDTRAHAEPEEARLSVLFFEQKPKGDDLFLLDTGMGRPWRPQYEEFLGSPGTHPLWSQFLHYKWTK